MSIRWKRAREGFVESRDGQWQISPLYWGCTRPQIYELRRDGKVVASLLRDSARGKDLADRAAQASGAHKRRSRLGSVS